MFHFATFALGLMLVPHPPVFGSLAQSAESRPQVPDDWEKQVRDLLAADKAQAALELTEKRLAVAPDDTDALGWHGRALMRLGRLAEAEADFQRILSAIQNDTDTLLDLALLRRRQGRLEDGLELLKRARAADPKRADLASEEGHMLRALGRTREARDAFQDAQRLAPGDPEIKKDLDSVAEAPRMELRLGTDVDTFNYTGPASAYEIGLRTDWNARWITYFETSYWDRFGGRAVRNLGQLTFKPKAHTGISVGGSRNHDDGVIPRSEAFFELDQGASFHGNYLVRGLEFNYHQQWFWFSTARVLTLTPSTIVYLPRDWMWQIAVTAARSSFPGIAPNWQPSGITRLTIPMAPRLKGNVFFAVGSEDYAVTDQLGRLAAQTWGGGLRWQFRARQYAQCYALYQNRTARREQASFGLSYGLRF
jgi:tetratricopeptide (TPR) repeat protein